LGGFLFKNREQKKNFLNTLFSGYNGGISSSQSASNGHEQEANKEEDNNEV
jgi:hypothetical protein